MAPAQFLSDAKEEGKPDVSVKSENKDFAVTKEAVGVCSYNGEDRIRCVGSLKDMARDVDVLDEKKLNHIVKSENLVLVDDKHALGMLCTNNCEDIVYCVGSSSSLSKVDNDMDEEIDIVDCTKGIDGKMVNFDDPDATECSSSFGNTFSGSESELKQENGDMEVDSPFVPSNGDPIGLDVLNRDFRKKKVSAQWRKLINPLMWRCQWLELRMKLLLSQTTMYDKELAAYKHEKELQSKIIELDCSGSRSVPFTSRNNRKRVMQRSKRKRTEDKVDISSYMSNHVVFSYYENKRTDTDGHLVDDDCGEDDNIIGNDDNEWLLGLKGRDDSLEQILLNIESVQSRIVKLKTQINNVMGRDVRERSAANLFLGDSPLSFLQNVTGGGTLSTGLPGTPPHHESECEMEAVMPVSEGSSYGDATDIGIIESTIGLLSTGDVTLDQNQMRDLCKDNEEDVLIDNQVAEEEYKNFEKVSHETDKLDGMEKSNNEIHSGDESTAPMASVPEASPPGTNGEMPLQTVQKKPCYTGKRRGRKPKKKKRQASLVSSPPQPKSKKLRVSSSSTSSRAHTRGPSKTEKLQASSPKLWRSERLKMRRLAVKKT
ncbi:uncharacterized protein LOC121975035 [Zingiber officinale]|uniref:Uncharacterized protein n=1 Tax=Zingiber officinale TaxID=94328 RepID=A0A8J5H654_ZINOF|nr:uncharacterized protein LOC121975035 [Zingiber officinale]KAG6510375.1 hypothetical protein ZIOFF_028385 [Zingiber officinale]